MGALRAGTILGAFLVLTVPLMPVQAALKRTWPRGARQFPNWYHRQVCRLLGIRLEIDGALASDSPVLLVSNHTSWLDIPVLSAVAPVSFVAKKEVGNWPFVSSLAKLQRTVFVDRGRRTSVGDTAQEMAHRFADGDTIVLFAEGTSSDGNRVLPFMTSLFAAVKPAKRQAELPSDVVVQTVSLVYTRLHGVPFGRADRPLVGWYGDMEMQGHAWRLLQAGPVDVRIRIGEPIRLEEFADRKDLARRTESEIRESVIRILRGMPDSQAVEVVTGGSGPGFRPRSPSSSEDGSGAWR